MLKILKAQIERERVNSSPKFFNLNFLKTAAILFCVVFLFFGFLFFPNSASAATLTSTQAGNLSDSATWGGTSFADGDYLVIRHVVAIDVNAIVGDSPVAGTVVVTVDHTGSYVGALTINSGVALTVRGDLQTKNATITLSSGSSYIFDSSLAAGTPIYKMILGSTNSESGNKLISNGTSGSHAIIKIATGSGVGNIAAFSTSGYASIHATYTDFTSMGNATYGLNTNGMYVNAGLTGMEFYLAHNTFTQCGVIYMAGCHGASNLYVVGNDFSTGDGTFNGFIGTQGLWLKPSAATTGSRTVTDNIHSFASGSPTLYLQGSMSGMTFERNIISSMSYSGAYTVGGTFLSFTNNMIYARSSGVSWAIGSPGDTLSRTYCAKDYTSGIQSGMYNQWGNFTSYPGTPVVTDGIVVDSSAGAPSDIAWQIPDASNLQPYTLKHALVIPSSSGGKSGKVPAHGNKNSVVTIDHSTLISEGASGSSADDRAIGIGSGFAGITGMVGGISNNLVWAKTKGASHGYVFGQWLTTYPKTGTASGGTTNTLIGAGFQTGTNVTLGDAGAKCVITAKRGSGPEVGETAIIQSNTATTLTFSAGAWSAAPDTGTDYSINVVDIVNPANVLNNAQYNTWAGTVYDSNGANGVSAQGYDNLWLTSPGSIGTSDINLGTGSNEMTTGPQFVDSARNFATFDTAATGLNHAAGTAWATGQSYNVGDIVSASTSTWYGGATINYRCIKAHTSTVGNATNGKPGEAAATSYRTNWEFVTAYDIRQDTSLIATLYDWVKDGFAVQNSALATAADDGTPIGAGDYVPADTDITTAGVTGFTAPATGGTPQVFGNLTAGSAEYTVTGLTWSPTDNPFHASTAYTATVVLTSAATYKFPVSGIAVPTANGGGTVSAGTTSGGDVSGNTLTFTVLFPATATTISATAIAGVTPPVTGSTPVTTTTAGTGYTGTVSWNGSPITFAQSTIYTATITLSATAEYTLIGVTENQFTIAGSTTATNPANSGVITAVFPITVSATGGGGGSPWLYISISAGPNGKITSSSGQTWGSSFPYGSDQTFTITPNNGYQITDVLVDGVSVGAQTSYTFKYINNSHLISATFSKIETSNTVEDMTAEQKQAKIQELIALINDLKQQIAQMQNLPSVIFTTPLYKGLQSDDVRRLQTLFATKPEIYPEGLITGYFGSLTEKAVQKFQMQHKLVSSGSDPAFGYVGPKTRAKLQQVFGN